MDCLPIFKAVYRHFIRYDYKLFNSFIFPWESDFFAESSSGYYVEVEVKVSRGDYFRDFQKEKHKLFKAHRDKRTHLVVGQEQRGRVQDWRDYGTRGSEPIVSSFVDVRITWPYHPEGRNVIRGHFPHQLTGNELTGWQYDYRAQKYLANDYGEPRIERKQMFVYAPHTRVQISKLEDHRCPNRFYFAVPEGLVKPEEVPDYAGLIYVRDGNPHVVREAPYLHKKKDNLDHKILDRFHNLWRFKVNVDDQIKISEQVKETENEPT